MISLIFDSEFFNIEDTLTCGQTFRFQPYKEGFLVYSSDKCCYAYTKDGKTNIHCKKQDKDYFIRYFDLDNDYKRIYESAISQEYDILTKSANIGKGIRILNQNKEEVFFSFIISQNNNIPRIKSIIDKMCRSLGERKEFNGIEFYTFPKAERIAEKSLDFFKCIGLGYRSEYIKGFAEKICNGFSVEELGLLDSSSIRQSILGITGIGPKVCDCIMLFAYKCTTAFPVDTWIEKVYRENFNGKLKERKQISAWFSNKFGKNAGYYQQYMFYYKRSKEKNDKSD